MDLRGVLEEDSRETRRETAIPDYQNDMRRMWSTEGSCDTCDGGFAEPLLRIKFYS
jgi:hypothetical protein